MQSQRKIQCERCGRYADTVSPCAPCYASRGIRLFRDRFPSQAKQAQMLEEIRLIGMGG